MTNEISKRLEELGITLPVAAAPQRTMCLT